MEQPIELNNLSGLPSLPAERRPKRAYVNYAVPGPVVAELFDKGWEIEDLRSAASATISERADNVRNYLEGIRLGTIFASKDMRMTLEFEAKTLGLIGTKEVEDAKVKKEEAVLKDQSIEAILKLFGPTGSQSIKDMTNGKLIARTRPKISKPPRPDSAARIAAVNSRRRAAKELEKQSGKTEGGRTRADD